jgi:hypothetical protein
VLTAQQLGPGLFLYRTTTMTGDRQTGAESRAMAGGSPTCATVPRPRPPGRQRQLSCTCASTACMSQPCWSTLGRAGRPGAGHLVCLRLFPAPILHYTTGQPPRPVGRSQPSRVRGTGRPGRTSLPLYYAALSLHALPPLQRRLVYTLLSGTCMCNVTYSGDRVVVCAAQTPLLGGREECMHVAP